MLYSNTGEWVSIYQIISFETYSVIIQIDCSSTKRSKMKKGDLHRYMYGGVAERALRLKQRTHRENRQQAGCPPHEGRNRPVESKVRIKKKSVSFSDDRARERTKTWHHDTRDEARDYARDEARDEERDDVTDDKRCDDATEKREESFTLPAIDEVSPALESCVFEALKVVNLLVDESDGEESFDGDSSSCYFSDGGGDDDDACFSHDTTIPTDNRSRHAIGPHGASAVVKKMHVIIPPGNMGVAVVDSKRGPLIAAVSKSCPVDLMVGDVIASVDGRDTFALNADRVLKILWGRSDQHRFLIILRTGES
jgi:hypothetical protein